MRILHLAHRIPYPPNKGDKIRTFNFFRHLTEKHEVHLVTLIDDAADAVGVDTLREMATDLRVARIDGRLRKLWSARQALLGRSVSLEFFYRRSLQNEIDEMISHVAFDAVLCSSSPMAEYVYRSRHWRGRLQGMKTVMDLIDVDSLKWQQYASRASMPRSWIFDNEARVLRRYEKRIYDDFDHVTLVSKQECGLFPGEDDKKKLHAIPNGVDLDYFSVQSKRLSEKPCLIFTGMMDYFPNIDGMAWFISDVLPRIRRAVANVDVYVVGGRPTAEVRQWSRDPGITVTGFVDDIRDYVAAADVCIVPLRLARGIQNKVLEALAMGKAVVSTPQALEGLTAVPGEDAEVAQSAENFADAVIQLLQNKDRRDSLGMAARSRVEADYAWARHGQLLEQLLGDNSNV